MKAVSISQPWAQLMVLKLKWCHQFTFRTEHRGLIAIHASAAMYAEDSAHLKVAPLKKLIKDRPPRGCIVAIAALEAIWPIDFAEFKLTLDEQYFARMGEPGRKDCCVWKFTLVTPLTTPVKTPGGIGLWNVPKEIEKLPEVRPLAEQIGEIPFL